MTFFPSGTKAKVKQSSMMSPVIAQSGDTVASLGRRHGSSSASVAAANPNLSSNQGWQVPVIPGVAYNVPAHPVPYRVYVTSPAPPAPFYSGVVPQRAAYLPLPVHV